MTLRAVPNPVPTSGKWTWEGARAHTRALRVSAHPSEGVVNLTMWRGDRCVGSMHLSPAETAALAARLTNALVEMADAGARQEPSASDARIALLEARIAALEASAEAS